MRWALYRWTWQLKSPLYVGMLPAGSLNRCRLYVPARAVWGAVTAEVARATVGSRFPNYPNVGDQVRKFVRFTYLFPAEKDRGSWHAWLPRYEQKEGLVWQREDNDSLRISDREFRMRLVSTRPSTAIDPATDTAAEGSLRETECMNTTWREWESLPRGPVGLAGYVFLSSEIDQMLQITLDELELIAVGGDIRYGLGRLERAAKQPDKALFGSAVSLDSEHPCVLTDLALSHALPSNGAQMWGAQEMIGGWDITKQQADLRSDRPVWRPGSRVFTKETTVFEIDEHGFWRLAEPHAVSPPSDGGSPS